jgi:hypothetical protein
VSLYAQPVNRIAQLTRAHLHLRDGQVHLRLGRDQVHLPEPLGGLLASLPVHPPVGMAGHLTPPAPPAAEWLLPGRQPDRPIHPQQLRARLGTLGLRARPTRTAALLQLAAEVPAKVLADLLGISPKTAVGWVTAAGGNWSGYAAARSRTTSIPSARQGPSQ